MKKVFVHVGVLAGVMALGTTGYSKPTLWMSDGDATVTVVDNGVGDISSHTGEVVYVGSVGSWYLSITWGVTKPKEGSATSPRMELHSIDAVSPSAVFPSTLVIMFSETDFGPLGPSGAIAAVGGLLYDGSTLTFEAWEDPDNKLFGQENLITTQTFGPAPFLNPMPPPLYTPSFSGATVGSANGGAAFSLTLVARLTHTVYGQSSFDGALTLTKRVPDAGSTLSLLGLALVGLGLLRRRG